MISLKSKLTQKLLNFFFTNIHEKRYLNELARLLEVDPKNLDRKLKELEGDGLFESEWSGKQKYYCLNKKFPLLKEYKSLVKKSIGIENQLREVLQGVKGIQEAYIFGSYASDKMDQNSDIDILIVGEYDITEVHRPIWEIQRSIKRECNIIDMDPEEFEKRKRQKDPFTSAVFSGPLIKIST